MDAATALGWSAAVAAFAIAALAAPPDGRPWARRAAALLLLFLIAQVLAATLLPPHALPWAAVIAPFAVLLAVQPFVALGVLPRAEIGLRAPLPGTTRVVVLAVGLALALNVALMTLRGPASLDIGSGAAAALLLAAVLEEVVFRGVLLALLDRALPPRVRVLGARIGWGGVAVTVAFVALHGLRTGMLVGILPAALLYLWLRARSGSLLAPIAAHAAWNLSVVLVH